MNLAWDRITPDVYVSTAALHREEWFGSYWLVETLIFRAPPARSTQRVYGTRGGDITDECRIVQYARRAHGHIVANLRRDLIPGGGK